ncbi:MAG: hypothetical protein Q8P17_02375 [bacterium]|nr:hypothetical protein [bacterium]
MENGVNRPMDRINGMFASVLAFVLIVLTAVETDWGRLILDLLGK